MMLQTRLTYTNSITIDVRKRKAYQHRYARMYVLMCVNNLEETNLCAFKFANNPTNICMYVQLQINEYTYLCVYMFSWICVHTCACWLSFLYRNSRHETMTVKCFDIKIVLQRYLTTGWSKWNRLRTLKMQNNKKWCLIKFFKIYFYLTFIFNY